MHTYKRTEPGLWTVGFETPQNDTTNNWRPIHDFTDENEAARFASFLNGGQLMTLVK